MPRVECLGEDVRAPLSDILRLFYGAATFEEPCFLVAGEPSPDILSRVQQEEDHHRVQTTLGQTTLSKVVSSQPRREARRQLYHLLQQETGLAFPWGSLTGIRPTVMARDAWDAGGSDAAAWRLLTEHWFLAPQTARLALAVMHQEEALLGLLAPERPLIYVGIPFCPSRCDYCSFVTQEAPGQASLMQPYLEALRREVDCVSQHLNVRPSALYVGGGTPTALSASQLEQLLGALDAGGLLAADEKTVEAGRPDTIDADKLQVMRQSGIQRLCINPQSMRDATLRAIGRQHRTSQTLQAFGLARREGFDRINLDLIAGLPGETPQDFLDSLQRSMRLQPESITLHALSIKQGSALGQKDEARPSLPRPDWLRAMQRGRNLLQEAGLDPYYLYRQKNVFSGLENIGFARPGNACLYNVGMMSDQRPVIGIGCGASSKTCDQNGARRLLNPRQAQHYIENIETILAKKEKFLQSMPRPF